MKNWGLTVLYIDYNKAKKKKESSVIYQYLQMKLPILLLKNIMKNNYSKNLKKKVGLV